jgi:hypothetical protein
MAALQTLTPKAKADPADEPPEPPGDDDGPKIVSLDQFRKK